MSSGEGNKGGNQPFNRQSMIGNLNNWINDLGTAALTGLSLFNFRRRGSRGTTTFNLSPLFTRSNSYANSSSTDEIDSASSRSNDEGSMNYNENSDSEAKFLNGTLIPTLKTKELIELDNFGVVEVENCELGVGHQFEPHELKAPTWCDSCSQFIWTPVIFDSKDTSIRIISPFSKTIQCIYCKYTCHTRCRKLVRIDCKGGFDSQSSRGIASEKSNSEEKSSEEHDGNKLSIEKPQGPSELEKKIEEYNERLKKRGSGLGLTLLPDGQTFRGFLRVHLNLSRPISVVAGTRPPSIYDIINDEEPQSRRTLTSFYMPRNTVKNFHVNSDYTSLDVIKAMLKKFKVVDNPQKFALYRRYPDENGESTLKRIGDLEYPLRIALDWCDWEERQIVMQENDHSDIAWEAFLLPELNNFLIMLDREEQEHLNQLRLKYDCLREELNRFIHMKEIASEGITV
ncbi:ras association domain-containing protein 1-like [Brevipalpus obovatus]|uniref:ras association domain-containing protein 1-like n=1 Tax=Brevipalpus obovatus TaxID=246614 RepID=UPI003D9F771B